MDKNIPRYEARQSWPGTCPNGPDEYGDYPCDPVSAGDGMATCSVCGFTGRQSPLDEARHDARVAAIGKAIDSAIADLLDLLEAERARADKAEAATARWHKAADEIADLLAAALSGRDKAKEQIKDAIEHLRDALSALSAGERGDDKK